MGYHNIRRDLLFCSWYMPVDLWYQADIRLHHNPRLQGQWDFLLAKVQILKKAGHGSKQGLELQTDAPKCNEWGTHLIQNIIYISGNTNYIRQHYSLDFWPPLMAFPTSYTAMLPANVISRNYGWRARTYHLYIQRRWPRCWPNQLPSRTFRQALASRVVRTFWLDMPISIHKKHTRGLRPYHISALMQDHEMERHSSGRVRYRSKLSHPQMSQPECQVYLAYPSEKTNKCFMRYV